MRQENCLADVPSVPETGTGMGTGMDWDCNWYGYMDGYMEPGAVVDILVASWAALI